MIVDVLAAFRLTRLVTDDTLTAPLRDRWIEAAYVSQGKAGAAQHRAEGWPWTDIARLDEHAPKLATLVTCRWCAGVWVAFGVVLVRRTRWWPTVRDGLAIAAASSLLARLDT